jgi:hypothetical protein
VSALSSKTGLLRIWKVGGVTRTRRVHLYSVDMEEQASTSSGAIDQRRQDALKGYRDVRIHSRRNALILTAIMAHPENAQP